MGLLDVILHLDVHLLEWVRQYGIWIYGILFAIIFSETGFVVTLILAAFLGNMANYGIGRWLGKRFFIDRKSRWLNPDHLDKAHRFYERHGGKAVVISRFLPIVRTYIPFVAGLGAMQPMRFTAFNLAGAILWVGSLTYAGFFFGNVPWIKEHLTLIIVAIVAVSLLPLAFAWLKSRFS